MTWHTPDKNLRSDAQCTIPYISASLLGFCLGLHSSMQPIHKTRYRARTNEMEYERSTA